MSRSDNKLARVHMESNAKLLTNLVYIDDTYFRDNWHGRDRIICSINNSKLFYVAVPSKTVGSGNVALSKIQSDAVQLSPSGGVIAKQIDFPKDNFCDTIEFEVRPAKNRYTPHTIDRENMAREFMTSITGCLVSVGQPIVAEFAGEYYILTVAGLTLSENNAKRRFITTGFIHAYTNLVLSSTHPQLKLFGDGQINTVFKSGWSYEDAQIGGLKSEFETIFRRAFSSRMLPTAVAKELGITHVKGLILYGPPGTGKTLIARQIGRALTSVEPKIISGPEILNKFVGESEENVRNLFADAEREYAESGENSSLHVIIFDEIDAISKTRGSRNDGTGVGDSVVNQLLAKMDGVEPLENILVIGMTNRLDMIDDALLRPGRFEVQLEISLPDKPGRREIFDIHTRSMSATGRLSDDVNTDALAEQTKNYTGAEIAGVVRSAVSFALSGVVSLDTAADLDKDSLTELTVSKQNFLSAIHEIHPMFGADNGLVQRYVNKGFYEYGPRFAAYYSRLSKLVRQLVESDKTNTMSILLHGPRKTGKSAVAAQVAIKSGIEFVKVITPREFVGMYERDVVARLRAAFDDAYKSPRSVIILDDVERIFQYVSIGRRFSNPILQSLLVLVGSVPPPGPAKKHLVLATTSIKPVLDEIGFSNKFTAAVYTAPLVFGAREVSSVLREMGALDHTTANAVDDQLKDYTNGGEIGIKQLITAGEFIMRRGESTNVTVAMRVVADMI